MKNLIIIVFGIISISAFSQNCGDFLMNGKIGLKYPWKFDNQSKSGLFAAGKTSIINIVCQEGKDYRITFSISSSILKDVTIAITDAEGNEYYTYGGVGKADKELAEKQKLMVSFQNQKLTIKNSKLKLKLDGDINNLQLEIDKLQSETSSGGYGAPKMYFEFTPASAMNLSVNITLGQTKYKGCVAMLVSNKSGEKQGF
jgi:hypothetical protein